MPGIKRDSQLSEETHKTLEEIVEELFNIYEEALSLAEKMTALKVPQKKKPFAIDDVLYDLDHIFFWCNSDIAEALKIFGWVREEKDTYREEYWALGVDRRYDFDEVVLYLRQVEDLLNES